LQVRTGLRDAVMADLITPDGASASIAWPALDAFPNDMQFPAVITVSPAPFEGARLTAFSARKSTR